MHAQRPSGRLQACCSVLAEPAPGNLQTQARHHRCCPEHGADRLAVVCRNLTGGIPSPEAARGMSRLRSFEQVEDEIFNLAPGEIFNLPPGEDLEAGLPHAEPPYLADLDPQDSAHLDSLLEEAVTGGLLGKRR